MTDLTPAQQRLLKRRLEILKGANQVPASIQPQFKESARLSFPQERLWFLKQLDPEDQVFNQFLSFRISGSIDRRVLEAALETVVERHTILRTVYKVRDGVPWQLVLPLGKPILQILDLSEMEGEQAELEADRLVTREVLKPFYLSSDLMLRARLITMKPDDHILLLISHHIAFDGWSKHILKTELSACYQAMLKGDLPVLSDLPIQYADYAEWQRVQADSPIIQKQLDYWKQQLQGIPQKLALPTDFNYPEQPDDSGQRVSLTLSKDLSERLITLSLEEDVTLFMTTLTALFILVSRLSGQQDVVIGAPTAARNLLEVEKMLGMFLNTLVLRADLSGNPTFRLLLNQIRQTTLSAFSNQEVPFELLLKELNPARDLRATPFFRIFFNFHFLPEADLHLPGATVKPYDVPLNLSHFDLTVYVKKIAGNIQLEVNYRTQLFKSERMMEFLRQYEGLLSQVVAQPDDPIGNFSLVTSFSRPKFPEPTEALCEEWYGPITLALINQATLTPNQLALVDPYEKWHYLELERHSNQIAQFLLARGIQKGEIVAIYAHRDATLVSAIFGVLKAGAAFLILDPAYPAERLLTYLTIAQPKAWIQLVSVGSPPDEILNYLDTNPACFRLTLFSTVSKASDDPLQGYSADLPNISLGPNDLAAITFTSGSTGQPKAVMARHGSLTHFLPWEAEIFSLSSKDRFSMLSGLSHDPLQRDIFTALWVGATVCIPDSAKILEPGYLAEWLEKQEVTFAHLTPPMSRILCTGTAAGKRLGHLRRAFFIGDRLSREDVRLLWDLAPQVACINSYGATETQRAVGYKLVCPKTEEEDDLPIYPIGIGMPGVQLLVLTPKQDLVGIGEIGEIYIRSPHLALGYKGDSQLTQERFITNPFTGKETDKLYRTGDMGRYRLNGEVEYLGRLDQQVKIRGFRIELAEIEAALTKHPSIKSAVIVSQEINPVENRLLAYLVSAIDQQLTPVTLRGYLKAILPEFMIPSIFIYLDTLPLTPNGKIDRQSLPLPDEDLVYRHPEPSASLREIDKALLSILEETLRIRSIRLDDNFFELGGNSLLAIKLLTRIEEQLSIRVPVATFFQAATIQELADILYLNPPMETSRLIPLQPEGEKTPFFCVHGLGGGVLGYMDLINLLPKDRPVYGIQAVGFDGKNEPDSTVPHMAERYITWMRSIQPHGPYKVGGYCFGGVVAYEIAYQLERIGESVSLLAVMEGSAPLRYREKTSIIQPLQWRTLWQNIPDWFDEYRKLGTAVLIRRVRARTLRIRNSTLIKFGISPPLADLREVSDQDLQEIPERHLNLMRAQLRASREYKPKPIQGRLTLFVAQNKTMSKILSGDLDPTLGWGNLTRGGIVVKLVDGHHSNIHLMPYAVSLARELEASLIHSEI